MAGVFQRNVFQHNVFQIITDIAHVFQCNVFQNNVFQGVCSITPKSDSIGSGYVAHGRAFLRKHWEELKRELAEIQRQAHGKDAKKRIGKLRTELTKQAEYAPLMDFAVQNMALAEAESMVSLARMTVQADPSRLMSQLQGIYSAYHEAAENFRRWEDDEDDEDDIEILLFH